MPAQSKKAEGWEEAVKSLVAFAEGEDEDQSRKAKRMLKALATDEAPQKDEPKDDEKKEAKAEDEEPEKKEAKAEDEKPEDKKAQAALASVTARLHALEVERATEKESKARAELLAKRPDFSAEVRETLENLPLDTVRKAVETWKRAPGTSSQAAAATFAMPTTVGKEQGDPSLSLPEEQRRAIETVFGRRGQLDPKYRMAGHMDQSVARAYLESLKTPGGK